MRKQITVWVIRVIVLALLGGAGYRWGMPLYKQYLTEKKTGIHVPTAVVKEGRFTVSFHENGTLDARRSVPVVSAITGKIIFLIDEGRFITAGTKIAELDTSDLEREVRNQKLSYENTLAEVKRFQAELDLQKEQNRTEVEQAQTLLEFNQAELAQARERRDRKVALAKEKLVAGSEVDQVELEVRSKELEVRTGEMALALKNKEVQSKESQKAADVSNRVFVSNMAKFTLEDVERRLKKAIIIAPANGMVVLARVRDDGGEGRRIIREGDSVSPRRVICQLPDLSSMLVKVPVGESDAPKVVLGMQAVIRLEAVRERVFHGAVENIASLATEGDPTSSTGSAQGRKNFIVTIAIKETDRNVLKPGMTADVEFLENSIEKSTYVPMEAVIERNGKTFIFIKKGADYRLVPVETGIYNSDSICILKGVRKGDIVALRDPTIVIEEESEDSASKGKTSAETKPVPIPGTTGE